MADAGVVAPGLSIPQLDSRNIRAKIEERVKWISDENTRREIYSKVLLEVQQIVDNRKQSPKNPTYWLSRTINTALRKELCNRDICLPNQLTEEAGTLILRLVQERVDIGLEDGVILEVIKKLAVQVAPIDKLEHWVNKIMSNCIADAVESETGGPDEVQFQLLTDTEGTKEDVERAVAEFHEKAESGEVKNNVEFLAAAECPSDLPEREDKRNADAAQMEHLDYATMVSLFNESDWVCRNGSVLSRLDRRINVAQLPIGRLKDVGLHLDICTECGEKWDKLIWQQLLYDYGAEFETPREMIEWQRMQLLPGEKNRRATP